MHIPRFLSHPWMAIKAIVLLLLAGSLLATGHVQATSLQQAVTVDLTATQDMRLQGGSPDQGFGNGFIWVGTPNGHLAFVQFDLTTLPADATVDSAELRLNFTGFYTGTANVELGRIDGAWDETTTTWNTKPAITFGGPVQPVGDAPGVISWDVTSLVAQWQSGALPNHGFALRGDGTLKGFHSRETSSTLAPTLVITYTTPADDGQPRPDLGDAPDSTNHHGINNTAYAAGAIPGQFPTVWNVPAGQPAGPRHANQTGEGILGQFLSREHEADNGPDQDGPNNILRNAATGAVGDVADNDRGDDGWRNRSIKFFNCREQTLTVRISKAPAATRNRMYLNVWFDGNRDGDWADVAPCQPPNGGPAEASYEWIVQDYIVDMTAIPAGGFLDFQIDTERVLNSTPGKPHWMRFTLSEARAVQPGGNNYPDGRGPHPSAAPGGYGFGETEDIFQRPSPPGEDGELILEKRVLGAENPVDFPGTVTYQIRLRHDGGSQPIQAQIRDQLPYPLHMLLHFNDNGAPVFVDVTSPTGGAAPLQADVTHVAGDHPIILDELVSWEGTLAPGAEVVLSFDVHVHLTCAANQQTETITNVARARPQGGDVITAEATFVAQCPGYDVANIGFDIKDPIPNLVDPADWTQLSWQGTVWNKHPISVTLGLFQKPYSSDATAKGDLRFLERITLGPDEQRLVELDLPLTDELSNEFSLPDDASPIGALVVCILTGEDERCPDAAQYPNLVVEAPQPNFVPRPDDLGDAPDSTNHTAGAPMTAYAGVQANYPTVFDPNTGLPQGPKHHRPGALHLGPAVSVEAEADIGPDADGVNNLVPPANVADQDWFDDGSQLSNLSNCQPARAGARVFVSPPAAAWFAQQERVAYLNVWLDSNRDGDWADGFTCVDEAGQNKEVVEHILIDYPIDVAALGAGLHNIPNIATNAVGWPQQWAERPAWVRFTLSEEPSNKPLTFGGIQYGDGRGYANAFRTGETEDFLLQSPEGAGGAPDIAVQLAGRIVQRTVQGDGSTGQAASLNNQSELRLKIDYINLGSGPAQNGVLTLSKNDRIRDVEIYLRLGPGLQPGDFTDSADKLTIALPDLAPGESSSIVLGLGPLPSAQVAAAAVGDEYNATVQIELAGDADTSNNQASVTVVDPGAPLRLAARVEGDDLRRKADTTCRNRVTLQGMGEAMQHIDLYVNDASNIQLQFDANGALDDVLLTNLAEGRNLIWAGYVGGITSPRDAASGQVVRLMVHTDLPVDPISLLLTDSQGRQYHPPTLGWAHGVMEIDHWRLRDGETYTVSINSCVDDPNMTGKIVLKNVLISSLRDDDGDGRFTGSFTYQAPVQGAASAATTADPLRLVVNTGGAEQVFNAEVSPLVQGSVTDAQTHQPLDAASVAALTASDNVSAASSDANPQVTGSDGAYSFSVADGVYRLDVVRSGYQPYRTGEIVVEDGILAADVALSPVVVSPANHIVYITAAGFQPAVVEAKPGDVVMWVNADLADHATVLSNRWDSGVLATGQSYSVQLEADGSYTYVDGLNASQSGTILVKTASPDPIGGNEGALYLPLVQN